MNKSLLFLCTFFLTFILVPAQDVPTTEIKVQEGFIPIIPDANRLNKQAVYYDTIQKEKISIYNIIYDKLPSTPVSTRELKAAKIKLDKIPQLYSTKISSAFGNLWTSEMTIAHSSKRSESTHYGFLMNHFSNKYESYISEFKNSNNQMHLYGKRVNTSNVFIVNIDYDRTTAFSQRLLAQKQDAKYYRNRFSYSKFSFNTYNRQKSEEKLKHNTIFFLSDLNERSENQIHLSSDLNRTIKGFPVSLNIEWNTFSNYLRENMSLVIGSKNFSNFKLSPSASMSKYSIDFEFGFDANLDDDGFSFFPEIKLTKELVKDVLLIHTGLRNYRYRNTLKSMSDENPYIHSFFTNQSILESIIVPQQFKTSSRNELYFDMRNVLSKNEIFEGSIAYGLIKNLPNFVRIDNGIYNRFKFDYIESISQLWINMKYARVVNNLISINTELEWSHWDKIIYNRPDLMVDFNLPINLRNKIKITPSLSYLGSRVAASKTYSQFVNNSSHETIELPSQLNINLYLYYRYSKNMSSYLKINNITNSKEDKWLGYTQLGFNAVFGLELLF